MKNVVLEGYGECGKGRWLNPLLELVQKGEINLSVTDVVDKEVPEGALFINKSICSEDVYAKVRENADIAIIVTSNDSHIPIALSYPETTTVLIDKPLSTTVEDGQKLLGHDNIYVVDHYLTKSQDLIPLTDGKKISFFLCENVLVEPMRLETLKKGMIEDLLHHCLACSAEYLSKVSATPLLDVLEGMSLQKAVNFQYNPKPSDPYYGDTSSVLQFQYRDFEIEMVLGKGLSHEKKELVVGDLNVNYKQNFISRKGEKVGDLVSKPHQLILTNVLDGNISNCPGVLSIPESIRILELNEEAQRASELIMIPIGVQIDNLIAFAKG